MSNPDYVYVGSELDIFKLARNWKQYWSNALAPFVRGAVLEVGGGVGANIPYLMNDRVTQYLSLEPDGRLVEQMRKAQGEAKPGADGAVEVRQGTIGDLAASERFDTIVYLDVLEHIEEDRIEVSAAAARLRSGGHLVVLAPAFQQLYSEFDRAIGHYRRYTARSLRGLTPPGLAVVDVFYLDAFGACLSAANRLVLSKSMPSAGNIELWDRFIIPLSRIGDRLLGRFVGRSVVCVWQKAE